MRLRLSALLYGWISIILLLLFSSIVLALLLRFTSLTNPLLDQLAVIAAFIILLVSGFISGVKAKEKGWVVGLTLSLTYSLIIYLYQYLGFGEHFATGQILYHLGFQFVTIIGAIFGVNLVGNK